MADGRAALEILVGEWELRTLVPDVPAGRATFEWVLDGRYLLQRTANPQPDFPDGLTMTAWDDGAGTFTQHYFDSRGVSRLYGMSLADGVWTLWRDQPDFSPLDFAQRFEGRFSPDGDTIDGRWETSHDDGTTWTLDFGLRYTRIR